MALQGWKEEFTVNHPIMDDDHKKLVHMISVLYEAMKSGKSKEIIEQHLMSMDSYAKEHLQREEKYLMFINYPDYTMHKEQHQVFLQKVSEFTVNYKSGNTALAIELLPFLNQWFMNHIMKVDKKYALHNKEG